MSKKRKAFRKHRHHSAQAPQLKNRTSSEENNTGDTILSLIYNSDHRLSLDKINDLLIQKNSTAKQLKKTINNLVEQKLIVQDGKRRITLNKKAPLFKGILTRHPRGFGFISQTETITAAQVPRRDPFIAPSRMGSAHHGDTVLIRVLRTRRDDRPEASIIQVLSPGSDTIVGTYEKKKKGGRVYPEDPGFPFSIDVPVSETLRPNSGDIVIVRHTREDKPAQVLQGILVEVLGSPDNINTQMRVVIEKFNLPHTFNETVTRETKALQTTFEPDNTREDLRNINHITIDGETAKDFDDAISVQKTAKGYRLFVSIADVSSFVRPGSAIDKEAYARGTSVYFPGKVIPMLPEKLSNDLCSLVPNQDRFTLTVILDFDRAGTVLKKRFTRSIICSKHRFTYTTVRQILIDKNPEIRRQHKPFLTPLKWSQELATALREKRKQRGSIDFNLSEAEITVNQTGVVKSIKKADRNFAHFMIEEFMIAANEAAASLFTEKSLPGLYRVHEPPAPEKTENFLAFVQSLDLTKEPFDNSPGWYARLLTSCKTTKYDYIINNLLLRSMQQARYTRNNLGHFGLASTNYTHFTSPIRRYPDLLVHRQLIQFIESTPQKKEQPESTAATQNDATFLSARERVAVNAEREINDRLKLIYMKDRVGESFTATISGISEFALFVEIQDLCVSGSIAIELLDDDYYLFDEKRFRFIGEISANTYQIGDIMQVILIDIDRLKRRISFAPQ